MRKGFVIDFKLLSDPMPFWTPSQWHNGTPCWKQCQELESARRSRSVWNFLKGIQTHVGSSWMLVLFSNAAMNIREKLGMD